MTSTFTSWAAAALTALGLSCGTGAQAAGLTFDTLPWYPYFTDQPYTEAGYQVWDGFFPTHGDVISSGGGVGLNLYGSVFPQRLRVIRADGDRFAVLGLDIIDTTWLGWSPSLFYDDDNPQNDIFFEGWRDGTKVAGAAGSAEAASAMPDRRMRLTFGDTFRDIDQFLIIGQPSPNRRMEGQDTAGIDNIIVAPIPLPATGLALLAGLSVLAGAARTRRARRARLA